MDSTKEYREIGLFYSPVYFFLLGAIVYTFWYYDLGVYGFAFLLVMLGLTFATCRDLSATIIYPFIFTLVLYKTYSSDYALYIYGAAGAIAVIGAIIHFIRFRPFKNRLTNEPELFTVGALLFFISIAISGVTVPDKNSMVTLAIVGLVVLMSGVVILNALSLGKDDAERAVNLTMVAIVVAAFLAAAHFITHLMRMENVLDFYRTYKQVPGNSSPNQYANLMARSLPVFFYLSVREKKGSFLWLIPAFVFLFLISVTNARATILMTAIMIVIAIVICLIKSKQKIAWIVTFVLLTAAIVLIIKMNKEFFEQVFNIILTHKMDDSGRIEVWKLGWERFLEYPIFGTGLGYDMGGIVKNDFAPYYYHNTLVQTISSFGIVGSVMFVIFTAGAIKTYVTSKSEKAHVVGYILLLIFAISLLDIQFYTPQSVWQIIMLVMCCYKINPKYL